MNLNSPVGSGVKRKSEESNPVARPFKCSTYIMIVHVRHGGADSLAREPSAYDIF